MKVLAVACLGFYSNSNKLHLMMTNGISYKKEPGPISDFFQPFWDFGIKRKLVFFFITHDKFYSWNMFRLEDIVENMAKYGHHNWVYHTIRYRQHQQIKLFHTSK